MKNKENFHFEMNQTVIDYILFAKVEILFALKYEVLSYFYNNITSLFRNIKFQF